MLQFKKQINEVIADNRVVLCDLEYMLTDDEVIRVKSIIEGMISQRGDNEIAKKASQPEKVNTLHEVPEKSEPAPIPGKKMYQADFITVTEVDGKVRVYLHCPVKGEKGEKVRYALKKGFKDAGAKWSGDYKAGEFHWTFQTKKQAQDYIKAEKQRASQKAKA